MAQKKLFVENVTQAALFEMELKGQLSDGFWENTRPYDHWMAWCDAEVEVAMGDETVGRNFYAMKDNYNFASKDLLDVVGKRMLGYARLALHYSDSELRTASETMDIAGEFRGAPDFKGEYYDELRAKLAKMDMEHIKSVLENEEEYTMKDMRKDLKALKVIARTRIHSN